MKKKNILLSLAAIAGASSVNAVVTNSNELDSSNTTDYSQAEKKSKKNFVLKVNFENIEESKGMFHTSHSSHASHASHSSHASGTFL
jgi:hypothetical protein